MEPLRMRTREFIGVAMVLVGVVLAGAANAPSANLVLRGFAVSPWPENEVGYTETSEVTRYWNGAAFAESDCETCVAMFGAIYTYPVPEEPGVGGRALFIPYLIWTGTHLFGASSDDPIRGPMGVYLADQMLGDEQFLVRLGIGDGTAATPSAYFPDHFFPMPVRPSTVGRLKNRY